MAARTPEGRVKDRIKKTLDALMGEGYPIWYFMPVPGPLSRPGIPDFLCCVNGYFLAIEAKASGGKPTTIQELTLERMRAANGQAFVVEGLDISPLLTALYKLCNFTRVVS